MSHSAIRSSPATATETRTAPAPEQSGKGPELPVRKPRRSFLPYGLIMPAVILEILIHIGPMILGVWIAFISLNQLNLTNWLNAPFVGLQNFVNGLNPESTIGQAFFSTVGRTMLYTVTVVGFSWILGMAGAVFLSSNFKGRAILRTFSWFPTRSRPTWAPSPGRLCSTSATAPSTRSSWTPCTSSAMNAPSGSSAETRSAP
ncbi:hypothetical protein ACW0JT_25415 [Arthrobacter sp. SA17]